MFHYDYTTSGTCSKVIHFDLDGEKVHNVTFEGGCNGNLKAVGLLVEGQTIDYVIEKLSGNQCGVRGTSCADQLAKALVRARIAKSEQE